MALHQLTTVPLASAIAGSAQGARSWRRRPGPLDIDRARPGTDPLPATVADADRMQQLVDVASTSCARLALDRLAAAPLAGVAIAVCRCGAAAQCWPGAQDKIRRRP